MPKNKNKASKPLGATRSKAGPTRWWPVPTAVVLVAIAAVLRPSHAPNASCVDRLHGLDAVVAEMRRNGGDLVRPALLTGLTDNGAARARWTPEFLSREPHGLEPVNAQQRYALAQAGGNTRPGAALPFTLRRFVEEGLPAYAAVWKSNIQPDFNVSVIERIAPESSAELRELDESNRFVQKSAESTSV